jgi:hypothetical protein
LDFDDDDTADPLNPPRNPNGDASHPVRVPAADPDDHLDRDDAEPDWIRVWSYGGYLLDDENRDCRGVDRELRRLVAQCLCDDPYYRPRLGILDRLVRHHIAAAGWEDEDTDDSVVGSERGSYDADDGGGGEGGGHQTDALMREWVQKLFGNPPSRR